jgi:hypothetical protein
MRMPRFTIRRLMMAVGVLGCGFALLAWMIKGPEEAGAAEAERDIAAGVLRLKTYGLPAHWYDDYQKMMKSRLGVEIKPVAACVVTSTLTRNVGGYNRRMEEEITRRFGAAAHDQIVAQAQNGTGSALNPTPASP